MLGKGAAAARKARGALRQRAAGARAGTAWAGRHGVGAQGRAAGRTVRAGHGRPGRWMGAQAGPAGPVLVHCAPGSVFGPGSTQYFPESPNEHCSL